VTSTASLAARPPEVAVAAEAAAVDAVAPDRRATDPPDRKATDLTAPDRRVTDPPDRKATDLTALDRRVTDLIAPDRRVISRTRDAPEPKVARAAAEVPEDPLEPRTPLSLR
jgi:hypothetical protein